MKKKTNHTTKTPTIEELLKRCELLEKQNAELQAKLEKEKAEMEAKLNRLQDQLRLYQTWRFGKSSEKTNPDQLELMLFNEVEKEANSEIPEPTMETVTYRRRKTRGQRKLMLENLPVETIEYRLSDEEQVCSCCGGTLHEMSTEIRQELKYIPAEVKVVKHVRHVYSCRHCEKHEIEKPIVKTASMPKPVISGSLASPSIMAHIMAQKYVEGLPLYRQERQFKRIGLALSRQTIANWMIKGADQWLSFLYNRMHQLLLKLDILHADETTLQVLHEPDRPATTKSYLWLYRTGTEGPPIVLYDYQKTRAGENPKKFLTGFKGYLQVDGYAGYHVVPDVTLVGCWAHARRGFSDVLKSLPANSIKPVAATEGLQFCNQLFAIERKLKELDPKERHEQRLEKSKPILDAFLSWLKIQEQKMLPKSAFGKAVTYCLNQWDKLVAFLEDGRLVIDNNRSERSIKSVVLGRKAWLFANTPQGARASAIIYSIAETAKENGLNPYYYLRYLFEKLPNIDLTDEGTLDQLLPWSTTLPVTCIAFNKLPK